MEGTPLSVYGWNGGTGGTFWYRISEPLRGLAGLGHKTSTGPALSDEVLEQHNTILVHLLHGERESQTWQRLADRRSHRLIIDVDDDVWNFHHTTFTAAFWTDERLLRLQNNIACADLVTTPNYALAKLLGELNPNVAVIPNTVPAWLLSHRRPHDYVKATSKFTLGYQGARQHTNDFREIGADLLTLLARHRSVRLRIYGELNPLGLPPGRVIRFMWQHDVPTYYRDLNMTVMIGPLADIPFNYGKSFIRALEASALGIPAMLTDVPEYRNIIEHGRNGWLIPPGESWFPYFEWARTHREEVEEMGRVARGYAAQYTTETRAHIVESEYLFGNVRAR
jgi:glycosyltransferase involved in cell wall biosynthesis